MAGQGRWFVRVGGLAALVAGCHRPDTIPQIDNIHLGPYQAVDRIPQNLISPIDILMVFDGSWDGMFNQLDDTDSDIRDEIYSTLLEADPNWRIGILDSTVGGQQFGIIRDKFETYPAPASAFRVPNPSSPSKVRQAVYTALELRRELPDNVEFLRPDAHLYVLAVTDNEDASDDDPEAISKNDFEDWFAELAPSKTQRLGTLTIPDRADYWRNHVVDGAVFEGDAFPRGFETMLLDAIGQKKTFPLSHVPINDPEIVNVVYRDHKTEYVHGDDFTYEEEANTITFRVEVPPVGSVVEIPYLTADVIDDTGATTLPPTTPTTTPSTGDTGSGT